ncbi:8933_t:CDS:1 [Ambispora gerdemannii]|uniref:8933_t:CDS:1 n=1 Tax=Ambispora gerdemannii TaxID=144530 RepID=A0A9N8YPF2_9GLOM|nr:8933_t:CDS:1 [Ambispora gerdemannii]
MSSEYINSHLTNVHNQFLSGHPLNLSHSLEYGNNSHLIDLQLMNVLTNPSNSPWKKISFDLSTFDECSQPNSFWRSNESFECGNNSHLINSHLTNAHKQFPPRNPSNSPSECANNSC